MSPRRRNKVKFCLFTSTVRSSLETKIETQSSQTFSIHQSKHVMYVSIPYLGWAICLWEQNFMESPYVSISSFFVLNCPVCTYSKNCAELFSDHKTSAHKKIHTNRSYNIFKRENVTTCEVDWKSESFSFTLFCAHLKRASKNSWFETIETTEVKGIGNFVTGFATNHMFTKLMHSCTASLEEEYDYWFEVLTYFFWIISQQLDTA